LNAAAAKPNKGILKQIPVQRKRELQSEEKQPSTQLQAD